MSKEAFPQVPDSAQVHIENFPPDLQTVTQEHVLKMSHAQLFDDDHMFGPQPTPAIEYGNSEMDRVDEVSHRMERVSGLLGKAFNSLTENDGVPAETASFSQLANRAKELAMAEAVEAKHSERYGDSVDALQTALAIESLKVGGDSETERIASNKALVRNAVSAGLASELLQAAEHSHGMVALQDGSIESFTAVFDRSSNLLKYASGRDFDDDFSNTSEVDRSVYFDDLETGDLVALAKLSDFDPGQDLDKKTLLKESLIVAPAGDVSAIDVTEALQLAKKEGLTTEIKETLAWMRTMREAGNPVYRGNANKPKQIDDLTINLLLAGEDDMASQLISSSNHDVTNLQDCLRLSRYGREQEALLKDKIAEIHKAKQAEFRKQISSEGASDQDIEWVLENTKDPESAAGIDAETWQMIGTNPEFKRGFEKGYNIRATAEAVKEIKSNGLEKFSNELLRRCINDSQASSEFLTEVKEVLEAVKSDGEGAMIDEASLVSALSGYEHPKMAIEASQRIFGDNYVKNIRTLELYLLPDLRVSPNVRFSEADIDALIIVRNDLVAKGVDESTIGSIVRLGVLSGEDPVSEANEIVNAFSLAGITSEQGSEFIKLIATASDKQNKAMAVKQFLEIKKGLSGPILSELDGRLRSPEDSLDSLAEMQQATKVKEILVANKLNLAAMDAATFNDALYVFLQNPNRIDEFCSLERVKVEVRQYYEGIWGSIDDKKGVDFANSMKPPELGMFPEIKARLQSLGLDQQTSEAIFASWTTFSGLRREMYVDDGKEPPAITQKLINKAIDEQVSNLREKSRSIGFYGYEYGNEEVKAVIDTFGIYNFDRYGTKQLHYQLDAWKNGRNLPRRVAVSARSDWNGAISNSGRDSIRAFGETDLFCFEVNNRFELAKVAFAVGDRERSLGRSPHEINPVEYFTINAHAGPKGILLGVNREAIYTHDLRLSAGLGRGVNLRPNNYRRHLGSQFRLVLKACSTAAEVSYGKNIAEGLSDFHGVRVEASPVNTYGDIEVRSDGSVVFNGGSVPGVVYQ